MASGKAAWKKQLIRVQQIADQKLGRSEKTEVLNEELQALEKRVEIISKACHATSKRLKDLFGGIVPDDKKLKKMVESGLSYSLIESGNLLEHTTLGQTMINCGDVEGFLARERLQLEIDIDKDIISPLNNIVEAEVPAINKQKRHLKEKILDMDAAKNKHLSAIKSHQEGKVNASKVDSLREDLEEAMYKVDQCRDQHATDIYSFAARETDLSKVMLELMKIQMNYHRRAWERLQGVVPELQEQIESNIHLPVFGQSLPEHLRKTNRKIAMVIEESVRALLLYGMEEEGLFRIAGGASKVKKLRASYDSNMLDMEDFERDPHTIAGAFKQYLRELPEPLLTYELYDDWMQAAHLSQEDRLQGLWNVLGKLPENNYNNLRYLVKFLAALADKSDINKMTTSNIAIVMGPNLLWPAGENGPSVLSTGMQSGILEALLSNADWFFQGEENFEVTGSSAHSTYHSPPAGGGDTCELPYPVHPPEGTQHATAVASLQVESPENSTGVSPKQHRKVKKTAPPPPQPIEKTVAPSVQSQPPKPPDPTEEVHKVVIRGGGKVNSLGRNAPPPVAPVDTGKSASLGRMESMKNRPERPAPVDLNTPPSVGASASPNGPPSSPGHLKDRPRGPPPERPNAPPPDKPPHSASPDRQILVDIPEVSADKTKIPPEKPAPPGIVVSKAAGAGSEKGAGPTESTEQSTSISEKSPLEKTPSSTDKKPSHPTEKPASDKPDKPPPPTDKSVDSLDRFIPAPTEKPSQLPEKPPPPTEKPVLNHDKKPEKPDKPPTPSIASSSSFRFNSDKPGRPAKPVLADKPIVEEKPGGKGSESAQPGHQRQPSGGGQKPPRPQPPPPPRPE